MGWEMGGFFFVVKISLLHGTIYNDTILGPRRGGVTPISTVLRSATVVKACQIFDFDR